MAHYLGWYTLPTPQLLPWSGLKLQPQQADCLVPEPEPDHDLVRDPSVLAEPVQGHPGAEPVRTLGPSPGGDPAQKSLQPTSHYSK